MSQSNDTIRVAFSKGYRVTQEGVVISPQGRVRKLQMRGQYLTVTISRNGNSIPIPVHRLAAYQLRGEAALECEAVRHLNGESTDNACSNLMAGTHTDNAHDRPECARILHARVAASYLRRYTDAEIRAIRVDRACGATLRQLVCKYGSQKSTMSMITRRKLYVDVV